MHPFNCHILTLLTVLSIGTAVFAQDGQGLPVSGQVLANGQPLSEVNITIKNTSLGTRSDVAGNFTINVAPGDTLTFSYLGMKTIELSVANEIGNLRLEMYPITNELDEVTVEGRVRNKGNIEGKPESYNTIFGEQNVERSGNSMTYVKGESLNSAATGNFANPTRSDIPGLVGALLGRVANYKITSEGVILRSNNSLNLSNEAIWEVDGVIFKGFPPPIDISQVEDVYVLRGMSSTVRYGEMGHGGVIVVQTKNGKSTIHNEYPNGLNNRTQYLKDAVPYTEPSTSIFKNTLLNNREFSLHVDSIGQNIPGLRQLAFACQVKGQHVRAIQLYRQILVLSPNDPKASRDLAQAFILIDKPLTAWRMYMEGMNQNNGAFDEELGELQFNEIKRLSQTEQLKDSLPETLTDDTGSFGNEKEISTRIVFEWADPASDFSLEIVNPNGQVYETSYGSYEGSKLIEEFYLDNTLQGEWLFNVSPSASIQGSLILKVTVYRNWEQADISKPQIKLFSFEEGDQTKYELLKLRV